MVPINPNFLASILENPRLAIISTGPDGKVRTFNRGAEELLGYKAEEIIGKVTPEIWHDTEETKRRTAELREKFGVKVETGFYTFNTEATITGTPELNEWTYIRKDGSRVRAVLAVSILRDAKGAMEGYIGVAMRVPEQGMTAAKAS